MRKRILGAIGVIVLILLVAIALQAPDAPAPEARGEVTPQPWLIPSVTSPVQEIPPPSATPSRDKAAPVPEGRAWGRVLQPDGLVAVGAEVHYTWSASERQAPLAEDEVKAASPESGTIVTDGEGRFDLRALPRGDLVLSARHEKGQVVKRLRLTAQQPLQELTLVLEDGLPLAGVVVGRDGQGIPGAKVMPVALEGGRYFAYESEGRAVVADASGAFRLTGLFPGGWTLYASAPGLAATITEAYPAGVENARIVLSSGTALDCRVVRMDDESPIIGATVTLTFRGEHISPLEVQSDASGVAAFAAVAPGEYVLDLDDKEFALAEPPVSVSVDTERKPEPILLRVTEGGEIRGRLSDSVTGSGIAGAVIRATQSKRNTAYFSTATDAEGAYVVAGLPPGAYSVRLPNQIPGYPQDSPEKPVARVVVSPGQTSSDVDFAISALAVMGGIVLDEAGNPVEGVTVRANAADGRQNLAEYYTTADGRFRFGDYGEGESVYLSAETRTLRSGLMGPYFVGDAGSDAIELRLALDCGSVIGGRVVDRRGQPFRCKVMAISEDESLQFPVLWPTGETDGAGNFVLPEACAGTYALHLVPRSNARQEAQTIVLGPGDSAVGLTLVYDQGELFELSGTVQDGDGNAVPDARVSANFLQEDIQMPGNSTRTDDSGVFIFSGLPEGSYALSASADGYTGSGDVAASAGEQDLVLELERAPRISGSVTTLGGDPVGQYTLSIMAMGGAQSAPLVHRISDALGRFSVTVPNRGDWSLQVAAEGFAPAEVDLGRVRSEDELSEIAVVLNQ